MKFAVVEEKLKTNKSRNYLWNRINTPKKVIKIEGFHKNSKVKKISENTSEITSKKQIILLTFIPKKGINMAFVGQRNCPLSWFEIKGEKNCSIVHGAYKRTDSRKSKKVFNKEIAWIKEHFLEELREIVGS